MYVQTENIIFIIFISVWTVIHTFVFTWSPSGAFVGLDALNDRLLVGVSDGFDVGLFVGVCEGYIVGDIVGVCDWLLLGNNVGLCVVLYYANNVGFKLGDIVGFIVGCNLVATDLNDSISAAILLDTWKLCVSAIGCIVAVINGYGSWLLLGLLLLFQLRICVDIFVCIFVGEFLDVFVGYLLAINDGLLLGQLVGFNVRVLVGSNEAVDALYDGDSIKLWYLLTIFELF